MKIGISSKSVTQIEMSTIAYWKIRARLLGVPGVANVPIWGEQLQQLQVQTDPEKMLANHVSLDRVMTVTADALDAGLLRFSEGGFIGTGGSIDTPNQKLTIQHKLAIHTPEDLAAVPIGGATKADGTPLALARRGRREDRPSAAPRRCRHQRWSGSDAYRREAAVGQHPRGDEGEWKRRSRT